MTRRNSRSVRRKTGLLARIGMRVMRPLRARLDGRRTRAATTRARQELRRSVDRWAARTSARAAANPAINLIGLDVARAPGRLRGTSWLPVLAAALIGALFLAGLRVDVIRMRLARAKSFETELRLEQEERELTVLMRRLRDPAELARRANELGFRRAERLIDLAPGTSGAPLPAVAAPPATELARSPQPPALELAAANRREARP